MSLSPEVEEIRARLHQLSDLLINLTCDQAEKNYGLAQSLMSILGIKSKKKITRTSYNLFGRFKDLNRDFDALRDELKSKDHEDLVSIAIKGKLGTKKDLTELDKFELTEKLVLHVRNQRESRGLRPSPEIPIEGKERLHQLSDLLINLTCDQAEKNYGLAQSLMSILGIKSKKKITRTSYNLFGRFKDLNRDFDALRDELKSKDHEDLVSIAIKGKLGTKKDLTELDKFELTEKLVLHVRNQRESWGLRPSPEIPIEGKEMSQETHDQE
jgi:hypothetical protein